MLNEELSKILAKTMQNSYRRKELSERINRIVERFDNTGEYEDREALRKMRMELEKIRKSFYGLP